MRKLLFLFICLVCGLNMCIVHSEMIETWGKLENVRGIDQQIVIAKWWLFFIQTRTLTFPSVIINENAEISNFF